jgi:hypothetical protein
MRARELRLDARQQSGDEALGEPRIGEAGFRHRERAGQDAHADEKLLFLSEDARGVERLLIGARFREAARERGGELRFIGQMLEKGRLQHGVEHARAP